MNAEMQYRQRKFLVKLQIVMAAIGIFMAITKLFQSPTFGDILANFLALPVMLVGLARLAVRAYQISSIKFGRKIYDENGNCLTVPRSGLGVAVGFGCPFLLAGVCSSFMYKAPIVMIIVALVLLAVAVFLFVRDVKYCKERESE